MFNWYLAFQSKAVTAIRNNIIKWVYTAALLLNVAFCHASIASQLASVPGWKALPDDQGLANIFTLHKNISNIASRVFTETTREAELAWTAKLALRETLILPIHTLPLAPLLSFLKNPAHHYLSAEGSIALAPGGHALWIRDHPAMLRKLRAFVFKMDQPKKEWRIHARVVMIDSHAIKALGLHFNLDNIALDSLRGKSSLWVRLSAMEASGLAQSIATPSLLTEDGRAAVIESGEEVPYQQKTSSGATSVAFKKAVLKLAVTPQSQSSQCVALSIDVNQDKLSNLRVNGVPVIHTQHIQTHALLKPGNTLVLGGIEAEQDDHSQNGLPGLSHVPLFGGLFGAHKHLHYQRELLVFVTPDSVTT